MMVRITLVTLCCLFSVLSCRGATDQAEQRESESESPLMEYISERIMPLEQGGQLEPLISVIENQKLVLLGEASHGTQEFYEWRFEISKRLIQEKGYQFIAVEGDWTSIHRLNRYIKHIGDEFSSAEEILRTFDRWPEWMWANTLILELAEWMRAYNKDLPANQRAGFYGMDVYGQWTAAEELISYISNNFTEAEQEILNQKIACFTAYDHDDWAYARALHQGGDDCEDEIVALAERMKAHANIQNPIQLHALQKAYVLKNAEAYFRLSIRDNTAGWNKRVEHMANTVDYLLKAYGENAKGIVWAHNTHVGDAAATGMIAQGMVNIGNLSREYFGAENVFITGFGTHTGRVNAGREWAGPMEIMEIPPPVLMSYEHKFGQLPYESFLWIFNEADREHELLLQPRDHRAIGVVYAPENDHRSNFVPSILPKRYDAFIFIKRTNALEPVR